MKNAGVLTVVATERLSKGVFVEFADGANALFPSTFLRAHLPWFQLDVLSELSEDPPEPEDTL